jgi:hypothetical protein
MSVNRTVTSMNDSEEINLLIEREKTQAHLLGVTVTINDIVCYAMIDQGCTCVIARQSYVNERWPHASHHALPPGSRVTGSTGVPVPMPTCVKVNIKIGALLVSGVLMYVVDDTCGEDICADIILGKTFLTQAKAVFDMHDSKLTVNANGVTEVVKMVPSCTNVTLRGHRWCTVLQPLVVTGTSEPISANHAAAATVDARLETARITTRTTARGRRRAARCRPPPAAAAAVMYGPDRRSSAETAPSQSSILSACIRKAKDVCRYAKDAAWSVARRVAAATLARGHTPPPTSVASPAIPSPSTNASTPATSPANIGGRSSKRRQRSDSRYRRQQEKQQQGEAAASVKVKKQEEQAGAETPMSSKC